MNLKDFLNNRDTPPELYWSLVLEEGWVQAGIWYIGDGKAEVVSIGPGAAWETDTELISATDAALSSAVQKLPEENEEPNKTVFGVPSSWVKEGEISEVYLNKIKKICSELSLVPVGFVVLPEAIAHLYKSDEGAPVSAIILGLGKASLEISVFKLGTLVGTTNVARSVSLIEDVVEGLTRFEGASPLPSRFVVYDGKGSELEEAKELLMQNSWDDQDKVKFLHTPNAEILNSERKVLATSLAGANEIGNVTQISSGLEEKEELNLPPNEVVNIAEPETPTTPEELGFAINEDVSVRTPDTENLQNTTISPTPISAGQVVIHPQQMQNSQNFANQQNPNAGIKVNEYLEKTKNVFHGFSNKLFSNQNVQRSNRSKPFVLISIFASLLVVLAGLFWWFYPKAVVTIYASPKKFDQEVDVTFSQNGEFDLATGVIPATFVDSSVTGEKAKSTTGKKTIGDKAKGSIQIQNGTAFPINVTAGTFLVSSGNLKFALDSSASVSAALSPSSPGTSTVSVTADSIGGEYNLAKDEIFRVGNYPKAEVDGTSTASFSGGSSQEILAVSKSDQDSLLEDLTTELSAKAKDELSAKLESGQVFVDELSGINTTSEKFDHKVGDEASNVRLSLAVSAKGVMADKAKLLEFAKNILKEKIPAGFVLRDSQITFKFTFVDESDGKANYKVVMSANFLPEISTDSLIKQIAGRNTDMAEKYLSAIPGFSRASVTLKPRLPGFFGTLPRVRKNISIEIVPEN